MQLRIMRSRTPERYRASVNDILKLILVDRFQRLATALDAVVLVVSVDRFQRPANAPGARERMIRSCIAGSRYTSVA